MEHTPLKRARSRIAPEVGRAPVLERTTPPNTSFPRDRPQISSDTASCRAAPMTRIPGHCDPKSICSDLRPSWGLEEQHREHGPGERSSRSASAAPHRHRNHPVLGGSRGFRSVGTARSPAARRPSASRSGQPVGDVQRVGPRDRRLHGSVDGATRLTAAPRPTSCGSQVTITRRSSSTAPRPHARAGRSTEATSSRSSPRRTPSSSLEALDPGRRTRAGGGLADAIDVGEIDAEVERGPDVLRALVKSRGAESPGQDRTSAVPTDGSSRRSLARSSTSAGGARAR